jgi:hypothetical protein
MLIRVFRLVVFSGDIPEERGKHYRMRDLNSKRQEVVRKERGRKRAARQERWINEIKRDPGD